MKTIIVASLTSIIILGGCGVTRPGGPGYYSGPPQQVYYTPAPYYGNDYYNGRYYRDGRRNEHYRERDHDRRQEREKDSREDKKDHHDNDKRSDHERHDQNTPVRKFPQQNNGSGNGGYHK